MNPPSRHFSLFLKPLFRLVLKISEILSGKIEGPKPSPKLTFDPEFSVDPEFRIADLHRPGFRIDSVLLKSRDHFCGDFKSGHRPIKGLIRNCRFGRSGKAFMSARIFPTLNERLECRKQLLRIFEHFPAW